jgi:Tol biopolymer transport system component/DNA-binding winged helix-turn-helix (wHTH) protein
MMTFEFDEFVVDPAAFRLLKDGQPVHIEPKALQVLLVLLERRDRPVTKLELLEQVWPGVAVTDNALTRAVAQLRKTLGDDAETPRYIETVPTRGYRFIGTLGSRKDVVATPKARHRRFAVALILVTMLVVMSVVGLAFVTALKSFKNVEKKRVVVEKNLPPIAARPLRPSPRFQVSPSFSPDGASVVYSVDVDGTPHLFVSPIDGSSERQVTNGDGGETQPSWSPDGTRIAFTPARRRGIWLVDVEGGEPVQLTSFGSRPAWSPDGREIAFQSGELVEYGWNAFEALPPSEIWIVDVATRKTTAVTSAGSPPGGHGGPSWRRDGNLLAFSSCDHERCGIFTVARDGSAPTQLVTDSRRLASPVFAADGLTVYYVLAKYNESIFLALSLDADGKRDGDPRRLRQSNPGVMQHVAISRDGFRFAWSVVEERSDLLAIETSSNDSPTQLMNNPMVNATFPSYSPDGKKIAYCAVAAGDDSGIWIADASGSNSRALVTGPGLKQYARWGRGEWNVFYGAWNADLHRPVLYRASLLNGRAEVEGTLPPDASAPAMSPDMKTIAFNRTIAGVTSIWTSAPDGSSLRRLTDDADLARFPVWSPSGKQLLMQIRREGSAISIHPSGKMFKIEGESWPWSWSPDEKQIAFAGRRDGVWNVWTVNVDTGKTRKLTNFTATTTWVRTPSWSSDGRRIIFASGAPRGNVWISEPSLAQP